MPNNYPRPAKPGEGSLPASPSRPILHAFDLSDWSYYVAGHDPDELWQVDDPETLDFAPLWMRPIPASAADDFGVYDDTIDTADTVERDLATGRFKARIVWVECSETTPGAEPWIGARYKP